MQVSYSREYTPYASFSDYLDARRGRELVENLLKIRACGIIDKGVVAEESDARLEFSNLDEPVFYG